MATPYVYFEDCIVANSSDKAVQVCIGHRAVWIPKSQLHEDCDLDVTGAEGDLIIPLWLADKNELNPDGDYEA